MLSREIVRRAIEFDHPPRLPFWQETCDFAPDDICDVWEMDRAEAGNFFDTPALDDWGCLWKRTEEKPNMGQVVVHPLEEWSDLDRYRPPNPRNPFYFARLAERIDQAAGRYVLVTSHFNLIERFYMLRSFAGAMMDFHLEPARTERLLDMILEFKLELFAELHRRFGDRVDGIFMTDDWGTQEQTFIHPKMFDAFFAPRYRILFDSIRGFGWHSFLHSCGCVTDFVGRFAEAGLDVFNVSQPNACGIEEVGRRFAGKICFLGMPDVQSTLPKGDAEAIREEVRQLVRWWNTPDGGFIVFNYGNPEAIGVPRETAEIMYREFVRLACSDSATD